MWSIRRRFGAFHLTANPVSARQKCYYWPIVESVEASVGAVFYAKTGITELEICRFYNDMLHIFSLLSRRMARGFVCGCGCSCVRDIIFV